MNASLWKKLGALVPLAMSQVAIAMVLVHFAVFGIVHEADEGTAAHVFQLLMGAQAPIVALFAVKWLPQAREATLKVLGLQVVAALAAVASVAVLT